MKSNRERLEENKSLSQAHAALVAQNDQRVAGTKVSHKIPTAIPLGDFEIDKLSDLANQFDIKRDADRSITRYETTLSDGTRSLVRDARKAIEPTKADKDMDPNSMKMLMIGTSRGALFLLDNCGLTNSTIINTAKEDLRILFNRHLAADFSKMSTKERKQFIQDYNGQVMAIMKNNNIDKIPGIDLAKDLDMASHAMNAHNRNNHISTITEVTTKNGDKSTVIETDVMALGVTSRQQQWMSTLKSGKPISDPWYVGQSKFRQALVRDVVSNTMNANGQQNNIIPTQLRTLMPLAKNASLKVTAVMEGPNVVDVSENLHSGAVYCGVKAKTEAEKLDVQWQAQEMASQLTMFAPKGASLNQVDSMSPTNPFNTAEKKANNQARKAMEAIGGVFTNTPLNVFRKISKNKTAGYDAVLKNIATAMKAEKEVFNIPEIHGYIAGTSKSKKNALEALSALRYEASSLSQEEGSKRLKMCNAIETAINARELMGKKPSIFEKNGNNNLVLAEKFSELNMAVHGTNAALKAGLKSPEAKQALNAVPYMNFNCMSGKDRTGVAMFSASVRSVTNYIKDKFGSTSIEARNVAVSMNKSGHTQQVPSQNNVGTHGVKKETNSAQKTDIFKGNSLSTSSASFNKLKQNEKAVFDREVEKPKAKSFVQKLFGQRTPPSGPSVGK